MYTQTLPLHRGGREVVSERPSAQSAAHQRSYEKGDTAVKKTRQLIRKALHSTSKSSGN